MSQQTTPDSPSNTRSASDEAAFNKALDDVALDSEQTQSSQDHGSSSNLLTSTTTGTGRRRSRRRTKTGCLTCRKRRIKCDEQHPTCGNCIKSRRICDGYNQRVVFRVNSIRGVVPSDNLQATEAPVDAPGELLSSTINTGGSTKYNPTISQRGPSNLQPIAPAPFPRRDDDWHPVGLPPHLRLHYLDQQEHDRQSVIDPQLSSLSSIQPGENISDFPVHNPISESQPTPSEYSRYENNLSHITDAGNAIQEDQAGHVENQNTVLHRPSFSGPIPILQGYENSSIGTAQSQMSSSAMSSTPYVYPSFAFLQSDTSSTRDYGDLSMHLPEGYRSDVNVGHNDVSMQFSTVQSYQRPQHQDHTYNDMIVERRYNDKGHDIPSLKHQGNATEDFHNFGTQYHSYNNLYGGGSYETVDRNGQKDREMEDQDANMDILPRTTISNIIGPHSNLSQFERVSFRSYLPDPSAMVHYFPTTFASPLQNPVTARIFTHWVYVVAPGLSIFEQHIPNPQSAFLQPGVTLTGPQNVWTYTVTLMSLSCQLLLHALLALSSLHIAKVSNGPVAPSHVHYHLALRRLRKALEDDQQRADVTTLVATLLLAYFETMSAEVQKWGNHVRGARNLLKEIDFEDLRDCLENYEEDVDIEMVVENNSQPYPRQVRRVRRKRDKNLSVVQTITPFILGTKVRDGRGSSGAYKHSTGGPKVTNLKKLERCHLQADMFWWFAKMDAYHAILGGNPLTLEYVHWGDCPPRQRIATLGSSYGSSDTLILIWGRIADFEHRDSRRKRIVERYGPAPAILAMRAKGGPPPGMQMPPNVGARSGVPQATPVGPKPGNPNPDDGNMSPVELESATIEAEMEWVEILQVLQVFEESLNDEFQPLEEGLMLPIASPFGGAIFYQTYSIACLQALYICAKMLLERCHPSMPSNVMVASTIASQKTASLVAEVCRISAGILPAPGATEVSPSLGAAMIEICIVLFFAGVQLQNPMQREWLVDNMAAVARLTGWATATRVIFGCEHAWEQMAINGRGPPYKRSETSREGSVEEDDENRYVWKDKASRAHWATGILGEV